MSSLSRLAVGNIQSGMDYRPIFWGLLDALHRRGVRIQNYLSRACLACGDGATAITGVATRHLDSWLMTADQAQRTFSRSSRQADLSVVEGSFCDWPNGSSASINAARGFSNSGEDAISGEDAQRSVAASGSRLSTLCDWLALPKLGVVDAPSLAGCRLPPRPSVDGLLLDRLSSPVDFHYWQTVVEALWGIPVVGGMGLQAGARNELAQLPPGRQPPLDLCQRLGASFGQFTSLGRLLALADRFEFPGKPTVKNACSISQPQFASQCSLSGCDGPTSLTVAVAYDAAFCGYFPDTLDALERHGVAVQDFSPLRDESLPADTDIVYIGCGHPELFAEQLADNYCLQTALRDHVRAGRRIYAEGGGLAYLCQQCELPGGERAPMVGILPAAARFNPTGITSPVELTLGGASWLGKPDEKVRGYLSDRWRLEPLGRLTSCANEPSRQRDLVQRRQAVGSRVQLNFALQPALLESFLCPQAVNLARAEAR